MKLNENAKIIFYDGIISQDDNLKLLTKNMADQIVDKSGSGFYLKDNVWYRCSLKDNFKFIDARTKITVRIRTLKKESNSGNSEIIFQK